MSFAPQHDYDLYNAVVAQRRRSRTEPSMEEKFQRYADYYNTLIQTRRKLRVPSDEARVERKLEKIQRHIRLVEIYKALDNFRNEK